MNQKSTVSVVLSTYNGAQYIVEQLDSIANQTRKPDEVLIFDDCSSDDTVEIVEQFIKQRQLLNWNISVNEKNKGWKRNFIDAFHSANGDLIFCADQDDIWMENKIQLMTETMETHCEINVLACNLVPKYEDAGAKLGKVFIEPYGNKELESVETNKYSLLVIRPGCTMCFKKSILEDIDKIWFPDMAHDDALWSLGIVTESAYIINIPLIQFRRHANNNSPSNKKNKRNRLSYIQHQICKYESLLKEAASIGINNDKRYFLENRINFFNRREKAVASGNVVLLVSLLLNLQYYYSIKEWVADVISSYR